MRAGRTAGRPASAHPPRIADLRDNVIDDLPAWLTELDRLAELDLTHNRIDEVPEVIGDLAGLRALDLTELSPSGEPGERLLAVLRRLPHLENVTSDFGDVDLS
jgi:Leucine-rich repeat (LRR) protein